MFYKQYGKCVLVFNHPTCYDMAILLQHFGAQNMRFVAFSKYLPFPLCIITSRMNCIVLPKKHGTGMTGMIISEITNRKPTMPIICIAPAGGFSPPNETNLCEFRSGAFHARAPVLPVVIRYSPYIPWRNDHSLLQTLFALMKCKQCIYYKIHVLDPIHPEENELLENFKQRVKFAMEQVPTFEARYTLAYKGCFYLTATSLLMGLPGLMIIFYAGITPFAFGILCVSFTSFMYHHNGNKSACMLDHAVVHICGLVYGLTCLQKQLWIPLGILGFIGFIHKQTDNIRHIALIHMPVIIGFSIIAYYEIIKLAEVA